MTEHERRTFVEQGELFSTDAAIHLSRLVTPEARQAFYQGVMLGMWRYAHWRDGTQYVGNCGTTLKEACAQWNREYASILQRE